MRPLRAATILLLTLGLLVSGCGLGPDPVVRTEGAVVDALLALGDGAEGRVTASIAYDESELRAALRDDAEARALLEEELGDQDVDGLLEALAEADAALAEHALLVATGADGSARLAASWRDEVWLDLRAAAEPAPEDAATGSALVDLQARVDWAVVGELLEEPDLLGDLDEAGATLAPFLDGLPDLEGVQRVLLGLLGGELVAISGPVTPSLLEVLSAAGITARAADLVRAVGLDRRELLETALAVDGFRTQGEDTLVDVHLDLRAAAELVLERTASDDGLDPSDVADARAARAALPDRLDDVATVRLGADGVVDRVHVDVLAAAVPLARAADDAPELLVAERLIGELDATGLFVTLDVTTVGTTPTVLGDPAATATPAEVARALSAVLLRGLGAGLGPGLGGGVLDGTPGHSSG